MYALTHDRYFAALKENRLMGLICHDCGGITTPPKATCDQCSGIALETVELSGNGAIRTYTVIRVAPEGVEAPYIVVLVELDEGPWLMGNLDGIAPDAASTVLIGRRVKLGHRLVPSGCYAADDGVSPLFSLSD